MSGSGVSLGPADPLPGYWLLDGDLTTFADFSRHRRNTTGLGVLNIIEFNEAVVRLWDRRNASSYRRIVLPAGFMRPKLALPLRGFAPDYLNLGAFEFASRRFREALAQPDNVVQFFPVEVTRGGRRARDQDYHLMRVLIDYSAADLAHSKGKLGTATDWLTGEQFTKFSFLDRMVLRQDFSPPAEVFEVREYSIDTLVSDAVARRVLHAECTGVEFPDPGNPRSPDPRGFRRYRIWDGILERRIYEID